jgi:hypothetical protein
MKCGWQCPAERTSFTGMFAVRRTARRKPVAPEQPPVVRLTGPPGAASLGAPAIMVERGG